MLCSAIGDGAGSGVFAVANAGCDMDWQAWGAGLRTEWAVSSSFQIGLEVHVRQSGECTDFDGPDHLAAE